MPIRISMENQINGKNLGRFDIDFRLPFVTVDCSDKTKHLIYVESPIDDLGGRIHRYPGGIQLDDGEINHLVRIPAELLGDESVVRTLQVAGETELVIASKKLEPITLRLQHIGGWAMLCHPNTQRSIPCGDPAFDPQLIFHN